MGRTDAEATRCAQGFADHLNRLLNVTVSKSRLAVIFERGTSPPHFDIFCRIGGRVSSLQLNGSSALLLFQQKIEVDSSGHCSTLTYMYRYQTSEDRGSWVCRWEYFKRPPKPDYRYPLAHVHVNAPDLARKHFPTHRVSIESVLMHLIEEWDVKPLSADWRDVLMESLEGFNQRRTDTHGAVKP